jgi:hypothetical protein
MSIAETVAGNTCFDDLQGLRAAFQPAETNSARATDDVTGGRWLGNRTGASRPKKRPQSSSEGQPAA